MAKGDTPSVAWMRDYFFDGKGGYDSIMTFPEFIKGPGKALYLDSRNKSKGGVIRKHFRYGGDTMGGPNDKSNAGQGSGSQGPAGGQSSGGNYGGGNNNNNNNNNGSTARERYIATQYNKTKTKTKGATNGGSGSNNNNNNNNTVKNTSTNNKNKRSTKEQVKNWMNKNNVRVSTNIPTDIYDPDIVGKVDNLINTGPVVSVSKTGVVPNVGAYQFGVDTNKNLYGVGFSETQIGPVTGNINFADGNLTGGVTQYGPSFDVLPGKNAIMARPSGSINYNDGNFQGNVGVSFDLGKGNTIEVGTEGAKYIKSFKKGGLLDKKRG